MITCPKCQSYRFITYYQEKHPHILCGDCKEVSYYWDETEETKPEPMLEIQECPCCENMNCEAYERHMELVWMCPTCKSSPMPIDKEHQRLLGEIDKLKKEIRHLIYVVEDRDDRINEMLKAK